MFALATVVALFHRRWGIAAFALAALVAWSRIYVGAHWPSDVPPSIGIGILLGWGVSRAARIIQEKRARGLAASSSAGPR